MVRRSLARRYLRAAFEVAQQAGVAEDLGAQLQRLQTVVESTPELMRLLQHPTMALERKLQAVTDLLGEEPLPTLHQLLAALVEHNRGEVLQVAGEVYQEVADEALGLVRARVTTALPLERERAARLREVLAEWLDSDVVLEEHTDAEIIGGVVVEIGDRVLDGSLRGRLRRMTASLTAE